MAESHSPEIHGSEEVAVREEERFVEHVEHVAERAGGSKRLVLAAVAQLQSNRGSVAEIGLDQMTEVIYRDDDFFDAVGLHSPQEKLEDRHVAKRHQRLRK